MPRVKLCPVPGCREEIQPKYLTCRHHWFSISRELRDRVWQTAKSPGSSAHRRACFAALHAAAEAERRDRESMRSESVEELAAFVDVVRQMRAAQRAWSQAKRTEDRVRKCQLEKMVDEALTGFEQKDGS